MKPKGRNEIKIKFFWIAQAWCKETFVELYENMKSTKLSEKSESLPLEKALEFGFYADCWYIGLMLFL